MDEFAATDDHWRRCQLCQRLVPVEMITQHHLKPRQKGGRHEHKTPLCKPCHKQLHAVYSNTELARSLDNLPALRAHPLLADFLTWIRRQKPDRNFRTITSKRRPGRRK